MHPLPRVEKGDEHFCGKLTSSISSPSAPNPSTPTSRKPPSSRPRAVAARLSSTASLLLISHHLDSIANATNLRSPFNDHIGQNALWGELYDGRAVITPITEKFLAGATLEECLKTLKDEHSKEDAAKQVGVWA